MGFEQTMLKLIHPFLVQVGLMWGIEEVNPAQEHFIANLIRQKLIVAIDGQSKLAEPKGTYLLFLPEGELHEIGLLFAHYLLKRFGYNVVYLGQNVPFNDLVAVGNDADYPGSYQTGSWLVRNMMIAGE